MIRDSYKFARTLTIDALLAIVVLAGASVPALPQASGIWTKAGSLKTARDAAGATLLQNGQVLVAGGDGNNGLLADAELYNPANGQWTKTGSLNTAESGGLTLLQNGQVLLIGADAELYNPSTERWTVTGNMSTTRYNAAAALLPNGKVLVAVRHRQELCNPALRALQC